MEKRNLSGELYVVFAGICWGLIGLFTRQMNKAGLNSIQVTFLRNFAAAVLLLVLILIKNKKLIRIRFKDIWMFCGTGILSIAFFNICYFKTIEMTSLSVAAVLLYTAPAIVVMMSCIFFKEKMNRKKGIALILAFAGCICTTGIIGKEQSVSYMGVLIGLGSGIGYALYSIFGTIAIKKYNSYTISLYTFIFASLALLPISGLGKAAEIIIDNKSVIPVTLGLSVISTIVPFLCYTKGLERMEAGKASIMAFIEPLVATICGIVLLHEKITISNAAGILLIFMSVILLNIKEKSFKIHT